MALSQSYYDKTPKIRLKCFRFNLDIIYMLIISSIFLVLSFVYVWLPYKQAKERAIEAELFRKFENFKLIAVRRYYPQLGKLSFEEIQEKYDIDNFYEMIGKRYLRH